jgi:hypothetical protein
LRRRGPGTYERAVHIQQIRAVFEAARRPPVPSEHPEMATIRETLGGATKRKPRGTPQAKALLAQGM